MDDHTGEPFDNVGVARRPAIVSRSADALNYLYDFLLRLNVIPANQDVPERRFNIPQIERGNIMERADDRRLVAENLLRFLQGGARRRHEWLYFVERHHRVNHDLARQLSFDLRNRLRMSFIRNRNHDEISVIDRSLIGRAEHLPGGQLWF